MTDPRNEHAERARRATEALLIALAELEEPQPSQDAVFQSAEALRIARDVFSTFSNAIKDGPDDFETATGAAIEDVHTNLENAIEDAEQRLGEHLIEEGLRGFADRPGYLALGVALARIRRLKPGALTQRELRDRMIELAGASPHYKSFTLSQPRIVQLERPPGNTRQPLHLVALFAEACGYDLELRFVKRDNATSEEETAVRWFRRVWRTLTPSARNSITSFVRMAGRLAPEEES